MPQPKTAAGRTGRPPVTSRAEILAAARQLIDRDGWEKLTIRRLAAELWHWRDHPLPPRSRQRGLAAPPTRRIRQSDSATRSAQQASGSHPRSGSRAPRSPRRMAMGRRDSHLRRLRRPSRRVSPLDGREHRGRRFRLRLHIRAGRLRVPQHLVLHRGRDPRPRPYRSAPGRRRATPPPQAASSAASTRRAYHAWLP